MKVLWIRFTLRRVCSEKVRTVLVTAGIALTTCLCLAVLYAGELNVRSFARLSGFDDESYPIVIRGKQKRIPFEAAEDAMRSLSRRYDFIARVRLTGTIKGIPVDVFAVSGNVPTRDGHESSMQKGQSVIMGAETARLLQVADNAPIHLLIEEEPNPLEVRVAQEGAERALPIGVVVVQISEVSIRSTIGWDALLLRPKHSLAQQSEEEAAALSSYYSQRLGSVEITTRGAMMERGRELLGAFRMNISIMLMLTLLVSGVMIFNAAQLSILRSQNELSILRTLGASRWYCVWLLCSESIVTSAAGTLVGLTAGYPLTNAIILRLIGSARGVYHAPDTLSELGFGDRVSVYCTALVVTLCVGIFGSLSVVWKAWQTKPGGSRIRVQSSRRPDGSNEKWVAGTLCVLTSLGFGLLTTTPVLAIAYCTAITLVAAIFTSTFVTVGSICRFVARIPFGTKYIPLQISLRSLRSGTHRHRVAVSTLAIAIALVVAIGILVRSFRGTVEAWSASRLNAVYYLGAGPGAKDIERFSIPPSVLSALESVHEIKEFARYAQIETEYGREPLMVGGADLAVNIRHGAYQFMVQCPWKSSGGIFVSETAIRKGIAAKCGDEVILRGRPFHVAGVIREFSTQLPILIMDFAEFKVLYPDTGTRSVAIYSEKEPSLNTLSRLNQLVKGTDVEVVEQATLRRYIMTVFDETFMITNGIRIVLCILAVATLVIAVWQDLWERRGEIKLMSVLGTSGAQLRLSLLSETAFTALLAVPSGLFGGYLLSIVMIRYINPLSFGWSLVFSMGILDVVAPVSFIMVSGGLLVWIFSAAVSAMIRGINVTES